MAHKVSYFYDSSSSFGELWVTKRPATPSYLGIEFFSLPAAAY